jgi:hypothetical protein
MLLVGWASGESAVEGKAAGGRQPSPHDSAGGQERARVEELDTVHGLVAPVVEESTESVGPELPHVVKRKEEGGGDNSMEDALLPASVEWVGPSRTSSQLNMVVVVGGGAGAGDGWIIRCWRYSEDRGGVVV